MNCGREFDWDTLICPDDNTPLTALGEEDQLVGSVLADRYEMLEVIGGGGMGLVYKARHRLMNRIVAIKMLHKHMISSKDTLKRFQLEAQAASCLSLPNILTVYDFGLTNEGQPYMVMDYLEGTSLADVLEEEHHLLPDRALNIFVQACAGLAHAHQKGVLHRDIKPSNIMLVHFGDQADFVKIVDFGIAKLLNQGVGELTKTGEVYGSPSYMSPEQCRGKDTDARSDIYSMGCVMYRTLSGRPLFSGDDIIELLFKQVSEPPAAFEADLNIPQELESAIFKALAKDPADRWANMGEFKEALDKYIEKRAGKVTATPAVEGPMPLWKRHGEVPAAAARPKSTAAAPNPVSESSGSPASDPVPEPVRSSEPRGRNTDPPVAPVPSRDESASRAASRSMSQSQTMPAPDTKHGAASHLRKRMADNNKVLLITVAAVSVVVLVIVALIFQHNSKPNEADPNATAPDQANVNLPNAGAQAAYMAGKESFNSKKYDDAKIEFEEALAATEKSSGMDSRELVPILTEMAIVYRKLDKYPLAESSLRRALPIEEKASGKNDLKVANIDFALAQTLREGGKTKEADSFGRKALTIKKASLSAGNPQIAEIQSFIGLNSPTPPETTPAKVEHPSTTAIAKPAKVEHPSTTPVKVEHPPTTAIATPVVPTTPVTPVSHTTTVSTTPAPHAAKADAHPNHTRHTGGHKIAKESVHHRRAYSSYGF
jgi:serine/threonine protein kinase